MSKPIFAILTALACVSLQTRLASADACASPSDVEVLFEPATDCIEVVDKADCNGGVTLTITNGCKSDLIGIERRSTVQKLEEGMPPLDACIKPFQDAKTAGTEPPPCLLAPGESGTADAWGTDELEFELDGARITAKVQNVSAEDIGEGGGCSLSGHRGEGEFGALMFALLGVAWGRRRRQG